MERKAIGKIRAVSFGMGGYQDAQFGVSFTLGSSGWGVGDFWGTWACEPDKHCKWTEKDQSKVFAETSRRIIKLLEAANKSDLTKLVGTPVEVTFDGNTLESWRVLTEAV